MGNFMYAWMLTVMVTPVTENNATISNASVLLITGTYESQVDCQKWANYWTRKYGNKVRGVDCTQTMIHK